MQLCPLLVVGVVLLHSVHGIRRTTYVGTGRDGKSHNVSFDGILAQCGPTSLRVEQRVLADKTCVPISDSTSIFVDCAGPSGSFGYTVVCTFSSADHSPHETHMSCVLWLAAA
jgi:hypothetical protein